MTQISTTQLKSKLKQVLQMTDRGEIVELQRDGQTIARIVPVSRPSPKHFSTEVALAASRKMHPSTRRITVESLRHSARA